MQSPTALADRLADAGIELECEPVVIEDVLAEVETSDEPGAAETAHVLRHILPSVPSPRGIESDDPEGVREGYADDLVGTGSD